MHFDMMAEPHFNLTENSTWIIVKGRPHEKEDLEITSSILVFIAITAALKVIIGTYKVKLALPGPIPLPLIGNALLLAGDSSKLLDTLLRIFDKYNGFYALWIGPKLTVVISKPEHLEIFCTHPKLQDKSEHYRFVKPLLGESIFNSNGTTWKQGRKIIMPTLRPCILKKIVPTFTKCSQTLVKVMEKDAGGKKFDVFTYVRNCTYDMIFETLLGLEGSSQTTNELALDKTEEVMDMVYQRALKIWLQWDPLYYILPVGRKFQGIVEYLNKFNMNLMFKSMALLKEGPLGDRSGGELLVEQLSQKLGPDFEAMREHLTTMIITGYDTTAGTLSFTLLMLAMHQDCQDAVYKEVCALKNRYENRELEAEDLQELVYLERVIKETLRLFPVGPLLFRQATDDVKFGDHIVPKGATVACMMLKTHRDPANFKDPLKFNPDNFLPENVAKRHPYAYIPFSSGPRGCIGMKYGMMSMKVIISELIYNYRLSTDITMDSIELKPEITMKMQGGFNISIEKRT